MSIEQYRDLGFDPCYNTGSFGANGEKRKS